MVSEKHEADVFRFFKIDCEQNYCNGYMQH